MRNARPLAGRAVLSRKGFLQGLLVQRHLRDRLLQTLVFPLEILLVPGVVDLQPTALATLPMVALLRDAQAAADLADLLALAQPNLGPAAAPR